jgi:hypothetical protein
VVYQLVSKLLIKLTLIHTSTNPAPARLYKPCINNYHPKYRAVHECKLPFEAQVGLTTAVVPGLSEHTQCNTPKLLAAGVPPAQRALVRLKWTPPCTRTRFAILSARCCGDKVATITISPCHRHYIAFPTKFS